jgi:hypothetical protein
MRVVASPTGGVDVRHHHAQCAVVERARAVVMLVAGHAHQGRDAGGDRGHGDLAGSIDAHRVVLGVDEQPVEAAGAGDGGDVDRARLAQPHAEGEPARRELCLGGVDPWLHGSFNLSL